MHEVTFCFKHRKSDNTAEYPFFLNNEEYDQLTSTPNSVLQQYNMAQLFTNTKGYMGESAQHFYFTGYRTVSLQLPDARSVREAVFDLPLRDYKADKDAVRRAVFDRPIRDYEANKRNVRDVIDDASMDCVIDNGSTVDVEHSIRDWTWSMVLGLVSMLCGVGLLVYYGYMWLS